MSQGHLVALLREIEGAEVREMDHGNVNDPKWGTMWTRTFTSKRRSTPFGGPSTPSLKTLTRTS